MIGGVCTVFLGLGHVELGMERFVGGLEALLGGQVGDLLELSGSGAGRQLLRHAGEAMAEERTCMLGLRQDATRPSGLRRAR